MSKLENEDNKTKRYSMFETVKIRETQHLISLSPVSLR